MPERDSSSRDAAFPVQQIVTALLEGGSRAANIDLVAETIGMSVRTLQRRLRAMGLTYSDVAQRARRSAAQRLLTDPGAGIGEIGRSLGYSDPAHFTRAFQRWTGSTPGEFRARLARVEKPAARRR
jgi:AraC-like DNA-binding protein